jgi:UDP-glucuronate 4-epimerase
VILVTGVAGFIGAAVAEQLLAEGAQVLGIDSLNDYYEPQLKRDRLKRVLKSPMGKQFEFVHLDLCDRADIRALFKTYEVTGVVHLAAQAGVRHSLTHPEDYIESNLTGFLNLLECLRAHAVNHCVYASSSSVYGSNTKVPFTETDRIDLPCSLYAVTKRTNELMAHVYAQQFRIPLTGLRFFTVYGPWGRPDMAPMKFTKAILADEPIDVYNNGDMLRDFTYIEDVVRAVLLVLNLPFGEGENNFHRVFNVGNNRPERLMDFIATLERALGKKAEQRLKPMQPCDVRTTSASIDKLHGATGWRPTTSIDVGLPFMVRWYLNYHTL